MQQTTKFKYVCIGKFTLPLVSLPACGPVFYSPTAIGVYTYILTYKNVNISGSAKKLQLQRSSCSAANAARWEIVFHFIKWREIVHFYKVSEVNEKEEQARTRSRQIGSRKWEMGKRSPTGWAIVVETELWRRSCCTSLCHTRIEFDTQLTDSTHTHTYILHRNSYICAGQRIRESYNFWAFHMCPEPGTSLTRSQDFLVPSQPTNPLIRPLRHSPVSCTCQFSLTSFE